MEMSLHSHPEVRKPEKRNMRFSFFDIQGKMWAFLLVVLAIVFVIFSAVYNWTIPIENSAYMPESAAEKPTHVYGIIFDAGSTASRIHVYNFLNYGPGKQMKLLKDTFREVKPGLSSYADHPDKGAQSLVTMLEEAKAIIPDDQEPSTPITLKATAGLRLIGPEKAQQILNKVHQLFHSYPFQMINNNVEIMSGIDEGVFSWITVNYLLNLLSDSENTVAALDLGGGSTQLTFFPIKSTTLANVPTDFKKSVSLLGKTYTLYTHSYLGLGLMSARFELLDKNSVNPTELTSPCFPPGVTGTFKYKQTEYHISARPQENLNGFNQCYLKAQKFIHANVQKVEELKELHIMSFSYFYDRGIDYGLIKPGGGNVTVGQFLNAAKDVCSKPKKDHDFLCMDLTYIYSLFSDGYTLPANKIIQLAKQVKGIEISWALGAVFDLFGKMV